MTDTQAADAVAELDPLDQMIEDAINEEPAPQDGETPEDEKPKEVEAEAKADDQDTGNAEDKAENSNIQKRFNKITADKWEQKNRADALEAKVKELEARNTKAPATGKPTLEQFDYDDDAYQEALIEYKVEQKSAALLKQQQEQQSKAEDDRIVSEFNERALKFAKGKDDFNTALQAIPTLNPLVLNSLMSMDNGPEVAYFLGNHLDIADNLVSLNPVNGGIKLGEISQKLRASSQVKISKAPEPIEPVKGGAEIETGIDAEIPIGEWMSRFNR